MSLKRSYPNIAVGYGYIYGVFAKFWGTINSR